MAEPPQATATGPGLGTGEVDAAGGVVPEVGGGGRDHGAEIRTDVVPVRVAELDVHECVELYYGGVGGSGRGGAALRGLSSSLASATAPARNAARVTGASSRGNSALRA